MALPEYVNGVNSVMAATVSSVLVLFIVGVAIQDWACRLDCGEVTSKWDDVTWGTSAVEIMGVVQAAAMLTVVPGCGLAKHGLAQALLFTLIGHSCGAVARIFLEKDSTFQNALFGGAVVLVTVATFGFLVTAVAADVVLWTRLSCGKLMTKDCAALVLTVMGVLFFFVQVGLELDWVVREDRPAEDAEYLLSGVLRVVLGVALLALGFANGERLWALVILLSVLLEVVVGFVEVQPFASSKDFNENAIHGIGVLIRRAAIFGLFAALAEAREEHAEHRPRPKDEAPGKVEA